MKLHTWFINIQEEIEMPYFPKPHIGNFKSHFVQCEPQVIELEWKINGIFCRFEL